jgi:hypothetical protein
MGTARFFNRGITLTQSSGSLPKAKTGFPTLPFQKRIADPRDSIRARLVGDLETGVLELLERAKKDGGECYWCSIMSFRTMT